MTVSLLSAMTTNYAKIASFVKKSSLSGQDRNDLLAFFGRAGDAALQPIAEILEGNPAWISVLFENYRAKETALKNRDQKAWAQIVKTEQEALEEMQQKRE